MTSTKDSEEWQAYINSKNEVIIPTHVVNPDLSDDDLSWFNVEENIRGVEGIIFRKNTGRFHGKTMSDFHFNLELYPQEAPGLLFKHDLNIPTEWLKEIPQPQG